MFFLITLLSLSMAKAQSHWKLQELAQAANALLVEMNESTNQKKSICGLKSQQVSQASQILQSKIDQRISEIKDKKSQIYHLLQTCGKDCTCDVYEYALEKMSTEETAATRNPILFTIKQRKICYQQLKNFCNSRLFKSLKK